MPESQKPQLKPETRGEQIKPLRTFESDVAEALGQEKISTADIVTAESKRQPEEEKLTTLEVPQPENPEKKKFFGIISGIIVLAGIIGFIAFWFLKPDPLPPPPLTATGQPFIAIDVEKTIDLTGLTYKQTLDAIVRERDAATLRVNATESIIFTVRNSSNVVTQLTTSEFLSKVAPAIPPSLTRSLEKEFVFGLIGFDGNHAFLVMRTNSYQNAYDGMLRGEIDFYREAGPLFVSETPLPALGTTSRAYYGTDPDSQVFHDVVINNIDTRAVKNTRGDIVFLYAFPDQATIVVTTNQKTFGEIIEKLRRTRLIR